MTKEWVGHFIHWFCKRSKHCINCMGADLNMNHAKIKIANTASVFVVSDQRVPSGLRVKQPGTV